MSQYLSNLKGYIADVPEVWFKRCDGHVFHFDELTQANVNPQTNYTEVNAGWSIYPVAYLPGQGTMELTMTSGQFDADLFAMANGRDFEDDAAYTMPVTETLQIAENKITLSREPVEDSLYIRGLTQGEAAAEGIYAVEGSEVTFAEGEGGDANGMVEVSYDVLCTDAQVVQIDNNTSAIGEAVFKWPVYAGGSDCSDSAIKGHVIMKVYKCRVTAMPGFDTSYKSAATNAVTFSAMDAKRADGSVYSIGYVPIAKA